MIKKKQHQSYSWNQRTDSALQRYIKWSSKPHIQNRIYKEHIEIPLYNIINMLLIKHSPYNYKTPSKIIWDRLYNEHQTIAETKRFYITDSQGYFFTNILPYLTSNQKKNTGGYIYKTIEIYLTKKNIESTVIVTKTEPIDYLEDEEMFFRQNPKLNKMILRRIEGSNLSDEEVEYTNLVINYWDQNINFIWNRKNHELQREIARNVVELFRRCHTIKYFRTTSMRRYLRKMMGWKSSDSPLVLGSGKRNTFNNVISYMRDKNRLMRIQYTSTGQINFTL